MNQQEIKIEKNIPLFFRNGLESPLGKAMAKCEIGDSFKLEGIKPKSVSASVHENKAKLGWEFAIRTLSTTSVRVWRVEPRPNKIYPIRQVREPQVDLLQYEEMVEAIIQSVCRVFKIERDTLFLKSRIEEIVVPRMAIFYCARKLKPQITTKKMGRIFGKDHGTITYGIQSCQNRIDTDKQFRNLIEEVLKSCGEKNQL
jgi:hypothetical protein